MSRPWVRWVEIALFASVTIGLVATGVGLRPVVWSETEALRYEPDMRNAWNWGSRAAREGYFGLYDHVVESQPRPENEPDWQPKYGLDYVPLRLAVMTLWAASRLDEDERPRAWQPDYAFNAPLLHLNTAMELAAALGVFFLARMWARRSDVARAIDRRWLRAEWLALAGFALVWFNPAALVSAHGRPTWDVWVTPFYVWAIYAACRDRWVLAGVILGIGTMFKGQQLVVAPVFVLWPVFGLRFWAAAKWVIGFLGAIAIITSPWTVGQGVSSACFAVALASVPLIVWGVLRARPVGGWSMPASGLVWAMPLLATIAVTLSVLSFGGSFAWFEIAFIYGADKFAGLEVGGASSLAGILQNVYGWQADMPVEMLKPLGIDATISHVLIACYGLILLSVCFAMRRYDVRRDARFVLAAAAPWIVYFAIFPKMHERYLLWGALLACSATIHRFGPVLLAIFFSACSTIMSLFQMLHRNDAERFLTFISPDAGMMLHNFVRPTFPGIGWAILLATAVWVWIVLAGILERRDDLLYTRPEAREGA